MGRGEALARQVAMGTVGENPPGKGSMGEIPQSAPRSNHLQVREITR